MVRQPAVAGKFYTHDPAQLRADLNHLVPQRETARVVGVISPHAGYVYSGGLAGLLFGSVEVPDTVLVLCPNHTGLGAPAALSPAEAWLTPLGPVPVNRRLCDLILKHAPAVSEDAAAHQFEHSLEVQLPFLQHRNPRVGIAALSLSYPDFGSLSALGEGIAAAIAEFGQEVLIVASSDMNHFESAGVARVKDQMALNEIAALNPEALLNVCRDQGITMCGAIPATVMLVAAKALGARASRLVGYTTSGEVTGDQESVVAYAAVTVF